MSASFVVVGLGHGDEGKGATVDFLTRRHGARTVVRFGGGPQAAHHVVADGDLWHCFSQVGSGTLVPGVGTLLTRDMLIEPRNLLRELEVLAHKGIRDVAERLAIAREACVVTPMHKMIGQMLEVARGDGRVGSVGMGVGQAVLDRERGQPLRVSELGDPHGLRERLQALHDERFTQAARIARQAGPRVSGAVSAVHRRFRDTIELDELVDDYRRFHELIAANIIDDEVAVVGEHLAHARPVVFEGAQGALLDPRVGPSPYVTKTDSTSAPARRLWERATDRSDAPRPVHELRVIGVLRAYAHRHGAGPLVTESPSLSAALPERHNRNNRWQGNFRVGWLDLLATRYAVAVNRAADARPLDALVLRHLDRLSVLHEIRVCTSYEYGGDDLQALDEHFEYERTRGGRVRIVDWKVPSERRAASRERLARLLLACTPLDVHGFRGWRTDISSVRRLEELPAEARELLAFLRAEDRLGPVPIAFVAVGPTWRQTVEIPGHGLG